MVLGTNSDAARAAESQKLLNWGFQFYDAVRLYQKDQPVSSLRVAQPPVQPCGGSL